MASVTEQVKESLVGTTREPDFSAQTRATFERHARRDEESDTLYMGVDELVNAVAPEGEDYHKISRDTYAILFQVADRRKTGKVSLQDWAAFEQILLKPDAEYEIAFRLFDREGTGRVRYNDFVKLFNESRGSDSIPFDWNCEWATLYIGGKKLRHDMSYPEFSQMLRGLQGERVRQAFHYFDKHGTGFIEPGDFQRIILDTTKHKLSDHLLENLPSLCNISTGSKISYANVRAFQNMIREMDLVSVIIRNATQKSPDGKVSRTEFLNEAARITKFSLITPMEADILFHFAGLDDPSGRLGYESFARVLDSSWRDQYTKDENIASKAVEEVEWTMEKIMHQAKESIYHFGLGSIAGAFGAFMVYPIDLVKTRMQNQRKIGVGQAMYKNSLDCAKKVMRNEGFRGFYSGVLPQLIGVAPEKAIKLTVNDLVRGKFTDSKGKIWWGYEVLAGGSAGACQVVFTNPLEIVKIRLQVQGELAKTANVPKRSALWIVKNLGIMGLYKGASACLLRDVPFSAIYFPSYNHLKKDLFGEGPNKKLGILQLLTAGAIAGMPAAYLTTPCDVIKTRLQVEARANESSYTSLRHCAATVYKEEGFRAFFKGGPARILRSSPQFGFTLAAYELLQNSFPLHSSGDTPKLTVGSTEPTSAVEETTAPLPYLRSRNALKIILDLDENFGRAKDAASKAGWGAPFAGVFGGKPGLS